MRMVLTGLAELDLEQIADYIAADNPRRALTFVQDLRAQCKRIADAPLAFRARPQLGSGVRSSPHGRYVIFFRLDAERIFILRILHGARDASGQFEGLDD